MLPFSTLIRLDRNAETAIYQQIANQMVGLIRDGLIQPGSLLPGSRELAALLKVHRKTIVAAYNELDAQDWIEAIPRRGIFVSPHLPELKPKSYTATLRPSAFEGRTGFPMREKNVIKTFLVPGRDHRYMINDGYPDNRLAPMNDLLKAYKTLLEMSDPQKLLPQAGYAGAIALREALAPFLTDTRGLKVSASNVLVTRGAQMAIYLAAQMILEPGDYVIVGEPNYYIADKTFEQAGGRLLRVPVDEQGIDVDAIEALCRKKKIRLLYIIPHHHHPTTVTLSMDRRMKLLDIIRRYRLAVIEDDYDFDFHYSSGPILPLASADHGGSVIYIGSLTKSISTTIRLGYMVATPDFIQQATRHRRIIDIYGDALMENALALLIHQGDLARHLKKSNKIYHVRRDHCCRLLEEQLGSRLLFRKPDGGMAIWARLHPEYPLAAVSERASGLGLFMSDGSNYSNNKKNYNALRIGFASLQEKEMEQVITVLKNAFV